MLGINFSFLDVIPEQSLLYQGIYNPWLVILSVLIAIAASYTALQIIKLAEYPSSNFRSHLVPTLGGIVLGLGVWSMHFIGMLGFSIPCGVSYDPYITAISMIPGVLAGIFALNLVTKNPSTLRILLLGGIILGGAIGTMHYTGMAAMQMDAILKYDPYLFAMSILVAVILAVLALWIRGGATRFFPKLGDHVLIITSVVMGGAVSGMHYTAMGAAYFLIGDASRNTTLGIDPLNLAIIISSVTAFVIIITLLLVYSYQSKELAKTNNNLLQTYNELKFQKIALDEHAIVSIADTQGRITYVNNKFCEISQYSKEELLGHDHRIINSGHHEPEFFKGVWLKIMRGETWSGEILNKAKDGSLYWVASTIVPFLNEKGKPYQYVSIRTDITETKRAQEEMERAKIKAEEANKLKSECLNIMSHELRTPMNGVLGATQILQMTKLDSEQEELLDIIIVNGKSLLQLINDILNFSRLESGKTQLHNADVNLPSLGRYIQRVFDIAVGDKPLSLQINLASDLPNVISSDLHHLQQILLNLLSNATKFTKNGVITVNILPTHHKTRIRFEVIDTGIGIPKSMKVILFERFRQIDSSSTRSFGGIGLGLSICHELVSLMGGTIDVESQEGEGSTFWFEIPVSQKPVILEDTDI